jgi:hypothetical protein
VKKNSSPSGRSGGGELQPDSMELANGAQIAPPVARAVIRRISRRFI